MIRILTLGIIALSTLMSEEISIGSKMPGSDYILKNINGKESELSTYKKENGLLVIFSCNTCPWVIRWQGRYNPISELCSKNNIGFVAVNSNASQHDGVDSFDSMKEHAKKYEYIFPYVLDSGSRLAKAFGAMVTPHVYLFDKNGDLRYRGAIDDGPKRVKRNYLVDAINSVSKGKSVRTKTTKSLGCSIKY
jgi:peroxiredoxin|tara:strand:- start:36 stop:611 length:576 start_codon:yes stop_codon:yes gene_type:complete